MRIFKIAESPFAFIFGWTIPKPYDVEDEEESKKINPWMVTLGATMSLIWLALLR